MRRLTAITLALLGLATAPGYALPSMPPAPTPDIREGQVTAIEEWSGGAYVTTDESGVMQLDARREVAWSIPSTGAQALEVTGSTLLVGDRRGVASYRPPATEPLWRVDLGGEVRGIERIGRGRVVVSGSFPRGPLRVMDIATGDRLPYRMPRFRRDDGERPSIVSADVQPSGNRLVVGGAFNRVNGRRGQLAMLVIGAGHIGLAGWHMPLADSECGRRWPYWMRQVEWSHDGTMIAFVTTGGRINNLCDGLTRVRANQSNLQVPARTLNTCYDTLTAVEWSRDDRIIYVGGHHKCIETERDGPMIDRYGLSAVWSDNLTLVRTWRVSKCRAYGPRVLLESGNGDLWIGQDCPFMGNNERENPHPTPRVYTGRLALLLDRA